MSAVTARKWGHGKARQDQDTLTSNLETITPQEADRLLVQTAIPNFRRIDNRIISRIVADILNGRWRVNGDAIRLDSAGNIIDGQHRLRAIVKAGVAAQTFVVRGITVEDAITIDTGRARLLSDHVRNCGVKNVLQCASAARKIHHYIATGEELGPMCFDGFTPNHDIASMMQTFRGQRDVIETSSCLAKKQRMVSTSGLVYLFFVSTESVPNDRPLDFLADFADSLKIDSDVPDTDPCFWLRARLIKDQQSKSKLRRSDIMASTIKAWNVRAEGRSANANHIRWIASGRSAEPFPGIVRIGADGASIE